MQVRIPAVYMRGGTSKAVFFHENHFPRDPEVRDRVILAAYGSPDPNKRQIDGMGGVVTVTSKLAIISPSKDPAYDVNYPCFRCPGDFLSNQEGAHIPAWQAMAKKRLLNVKIVFTALMVLIFWYGFYGAFEFGFLAKIFPLYISLFCFMLGLIDLAMEIRHS